jgi:acyl carrier protein
MNQLAEVVVACVVELSRMKRSFDGPVELHHSLVDDLGFDSLLFVDLTVLLEERTALDDLPMLDWADREAMKKAGPRYTLRSLVEAVERHAQRPRAIEGIEPLSAGRAAWGSRADRQ